MGILAAIPKPVRKAVIAVTPEPLVQWARRAVSREWDPSLVVARESPAHRWFAQHVLRLYYLPSMVSRQNAAQRWLSARVQHKRPRLFHFEIHITDHCNLNCEGCGHFSNLCPPFLLDMDDFRRDMEAMAQRFEVEQIFLLGGEPLLHPRVAEFVRAAREYFPTTRIYLMTNGTLVLRMNQEFWDSLRETQTILLCDLYPISLPVEQIDALGAANGVTVEWTGYRGEFFRVPIDLDGAQDAANSHLRCRGLYNCPMVRNGRIYPCAYAAYADVLADRFDLPELEATDADSMSITDDRDPQEIMEFLLRPVPWCSHCNYDAFRTFKWGRSSRELSEWVDEPSGSAAAARCEDSEQREHERS